MKIFTSYRSVAIAIGIGLSSLLSVCANAAQTLDPNDQATNVLLDSTELPTTNLLLAPSDEPTPPEAGANGLISPDIIINLGKFLWDVIKDGKPVVDIHADVANALPEGIASWQSLAGWQAPISKNYEFNWTLFGGNVVKFHYSLVFTHGGNLDGVGRYLTNVMIVPTKVKVMWGYDLAAQVNVLRTMNIGTRENPISALEIVLKWTLDSMVAHHERSATFYVTGDGQFKEVAFQ